MVWRFYFERREKLTKVKPNAAHLAISNWQSHFEVLPVITQNVDGLHQTAGSTNVLELHGSLVTSRCIACTEERYDSQFESVDGGVPRCECGGMLRPGVVWFGESLPEGVIESAFEAAANCETLIVIGTSNQVQPAAQIPVIASDAGARVIEVNPEPTPLTHLADHFLQGKAGDIVPGLLEKYLL